MIEYRRKKGQKIGREKFELQYLVSGAIIRNSLILADLQIQGVKYQPKSAKKNPFSQNVNYEILIKLPIRFPN